MSKVYSLRTGNAYPASLPCPGCGEATFSRMLMDSKGEEAHYTHAASCWMTTLSVIVGPPVFSPSL